MDKVLKWKTSMDNYYQHISAQKLKIDLETAGFSVNSIQNIENIRCLYPSITETSVAVSLEVPDVEEELVPNYTTQVKIV